MSTWESRTFVCPRCSAAVTMRVALGVHVERAPHVRDDVLARRLHSTACACGATVRADAHFEFADFDRRQLFLVGRRAELASWPALELKVRATVKRLVLGSPLTSALVNGLTARLVFGVAELREKLVLADAGLDDALVECMKVRAFAADPTLASPGSRLLVDEVTADDRLRCMWSGEDGTASGIELPAAWVRDAARDRGSLAARFPELFRGEFVSVDRYRVSC
jgi:hypothetical protein